MKDRPILFQADMVRALVAGTKTQTRRPVKPSPYLHLGRDGIEKWHWRPRLGLLLHPGTPEMAALCPYGQPGDRLWVREAWRVSRKFDGMPPRDILPRKCTVFFEAGGSIANQVSGQWEEDRSYSASDAGDWVGKYRPPMFMPRWASRLTLEITDVRVERLQDISRTDAQAEGCEHDDPCDHARQSCASIGCEGPDYRIGYRNLWERINGAGSWAANPWVWAVSFKVVTS